MLFVLFYFGGISYSTIVNGYLLALRSNGVLELGTTEFGIVSIINFIFTAIGAIIMGKISKKYEGIFILIPFTFLGLLLIPKLEIFEK